METCQVCFNNSACYICICVEKKICDQCLLGHVDKTKKDTHRLVAVSHPILTLMMEATKEINKAGADLNEENLEIQIKNLEDFRSKSNRMIEKKIRDLQERVRRQNITVSSYLSPVKAHRKSFSQYSFSEQKTKKPFSENFPNTNYYKIAVVGGPLVGKSALISSFSSVQGRPSKTSQTSASRKVLIENNVITVELSEFSNNFFDSDGAIFLFDLTQAESFQSLPRLIQSVPSSFTKYLIGSKFDLVSTSPKLRAVSFQCGQELAQSFNCTYLELDLQSPSQVVELFKKLVKEVYLNKL